MPFFNDFRFYTLSRVRGDEITVGGLKSVYQVTFLVNDAQMSIVLLCFHF